MPIKKLGGQPYTGANSVYKIASAYATTIFQGDLVKLGNADGTIQKDTGTTTATPVGVFVGCAYTDPNLKYKVFKNLWVASTVATDAVAYVVDDPDMIFKIQGDGLGTIYGQTSLGTNAALIQTAGNTTSGISAVALDSSSVANTSGLPLKIINVDPGPTNALTDLYVDFWVMINITTHFWRTATANAAV